jgi:hypothetical protein
MAMIKPQKTSVVVLITLAELAWLAAFGLLFAYRGKDIELHKMAGQHQVVTNRLAEWEAASPDTAKLLGDLELARQETNRLSAELQILASQLGGLDGREVAAVLSSAEIAKSNWASAEQTIRSLEGQLARLQAAHTNAVQSLDAANREVTLLQREKAEGDGKLAGMQQDVSSLKQEKLRISDDKATLENRVRQLELGEVAIRRELTGLPTNELHRVVFVVDSSSSMYNSPAWKSARELIRTWVEYLSVQECVLINFSDQADAFPKSGYHRVRDETGKVLAHRREELLAAFDSAKVGVYSDLLKALKSAYNYPQCDLIVLFTDGQPRVPTASDASYAAGILKEVEWHSDIPILAVAVGSYEIEGAGGPREKANAAIVFLKALAKKTGGSFLGR